MIYFDNAASTIPLRSVLDNIIENEENTYFNPSSSHVGGFRSARLLSKSRETIAKAVGANPEEVYFTSGATESNNMVFQSAVSRLNSGNIVISSIEHPSMENCALFFERKGIDIRRVPCGRGGGITPEALKSVMDQRTALFAFIHVNNETGIIQDAVKLIETAKAISPRVHVHTDSVQGFCKISSFPEADSVSLSAHKLHGLKGTGALIIKKGSLIHPLMQGGGQEKGLRPGTENIPGIMAFAHTVSKLYPHTEERFASVSVLSDILSAFCASSGDYTANREEGISYSPYIFSLSHSHIPGSVLQNALGERGIYVSTGSACSDKISGSRVLGSMGYSKERGLNTIRISFSLFSTEEEVRTLIRSLEEIHDKYSSVYEILRKGE